jgi:hypothetical protein
MPDERHGNDANLVTEDLRRAADANGQDLATTLGNLRQSLDAMPVRNTAGAPAGSGSSRSDGFPA